MIFRCIDQIALRMAGEPDVTSRAVIEHDNHRYAVIELDELNLTCVRLDQARVQPLPERPLPFHATATYQGEVSAADLVTIAGWLDADFVP